MIFRASAPRWAVIGQRFGSLKQYLIAATEDDRWAQTLRSLNQRYFDDTYPDEWWLVWVDDRRLDPRPPGPQR